MKGNGKKGAPRDGAAAAAEQTFLYGSRCSLPAMLHLFDADCEGDALLLLMAGAAEGGVFETSAFVILKHHLEDALKSKCPETQAVSVCGLPACAVPEAWGELRSRS